MSRMIVWSLKKQVRSSPIPFLHGLHGRAGIEGSLGQMMVVEPSVSQKGLLQVVATEEVMAAQHLFDTAVEALHHPVGLRPTWAGEPMLDAESVAQRIEGMLSGGRALARGDEAVGELLAIVGEDRVDAPVGQGPRRPGKRAPLVRFCGS